MLFAFIAVLNITCNTGQTKQDTSEDKIIKVISPEEYKKSVVDQVLIDVRTEKEYQAGHLEGAKNINFMGSDFEAGLAELDKDTPVYLYCRSGKRSAAASKKMKALGFKSITDLQGGILNWQKSNFKTVK